MTTFHELKSLHKSFVLGWDDRKKLAEAGGFDTIVEIMDQTMGDIAVQMTCLKAVAMLCVDQGEKIMIPVSKW